MSIAAKADQVTQNTQAIQLKTPKEKVNFSELAPEVQTIIMKRELWEPLGPQKVNFDISKEEYDKLLNQVLNS